MPGRRNFSFLPNPRSRVPPGVNPPLPSPLSPVPQEAGWTQPSGDAQALPAPGCTPRSLPPGCILIFVGSPSLTPFRIILVAPGTAPVVQAPGRDRDPSPQGAPQQRRILQHSPASLPGKGSWGGGPLNLVSLDLDHLFSQVGVAGVHGCMASFSWPDSPPALLPSPLVGGLGAPLLHPRGAIPCCP